MLRCSEYTTYCILQLISVLLSMLIFAIRRMDANVIVKIFARQGMHRFGRSRMAAVASAVARRKAFSMATMPPSSRAYAIVLSKYMSQPRQ